MKKNPRIPEYPIDPLFLQRYSPRKFSSKKIAPQTLMSLFEAARWSPSSFNEQPWNFVYATTKEEKETLLSALTESNKEWASTAPVLLFLYTKRDYSKNGKTNPTAQFDAGAAWMSFTIQARKLALYTHGMSGFDSEKAYEILQIPEDKFKLICAIAVGYSDEQDPQFNDRKKVEEFVYKGKYSK